MEKQVEVPPLFVCPICGHRVQGIKPAELEGKYAFIVHGQDGYTGHRVTFREFIGCYVTEREYLDMIKKTNAESEEDDID